jgi:hypothetical protein
MCVFVDSTLAQVSGLEEHQLDAGPGIGIIIAANHRLMAGFASLAAARSARGQLYWHALEPFLVEMEVGNTFRQHPLPVKLPAASARRAETK